jgi:copper(I)-binding protein
MLQMNKVIFAIVLLVFALLFTSALAHEHKMPKGKVSFDNVWARATFALAKTGAVYLDLNNNSKHQIKLLSVNVEASIASEAQLHETFMDEDDDGMDGGMDAGMMQMREARDGFIIPSGSSLVFEPGGKHIMLLGLENPLSEGDKFILSFTFENNKVVRVPVVVEDAR